MLFSFDVETDGLYGPAFAAAAVVMDENGKILDQFCEKCMTPPILDDWVKANSLPHLEDIPECESRRALRDHFWNFYMKYKAQCTIVADTPYPVESGFLRACVEDCPEARIWQGPYPLLDVASILYAHGLDPDADRLAFSGQEGKRHHPLDDAIASALCLLKAMKTNG